MVVKTSKIKCHRGVSLISTMVAVAILLIALIGTSTFRYAAALDERRADAHTTAARVALTLGESWRGVKGDLTYDPIAHLGGDLTITSTKQQFPIRQDFTLLGSYVVVLDSDDPDSINYNATLSWKDIQPGLRALGIVIRWSTREVDEVAIENKSFGLTVYTQTL